MSQTEDNKALMRDYLDGFWNRSLAAYARAAEEHSHTRQEHP